MRRRLCSALALAATLALATSTARPSLAQGTCPSSYGDISAFVTVCRADALQLPCLVNNSTNYCTAAGSPGVTYANCTTALSSLIDTGTGAGGTCITMLSAIAPVDQDAETLAQTDCALSMAAYVQKYCHPQLCPSESTLSTLLPLARCLVDVPQSLSGSALDSYSAYACLQSGDSTNGVPTECQPGSSIDLYQLCTESTEQVVASVLGINATTACPSVLVGPLTEYCAMQFGAAIADFCTPTFCENPFPGSSTLSLCTGIGVVAGTVGGSILLAIAFAFLYRRWKRQEQAQAAAMGMGSPGPLAPIQPGGGSPKPLSPAQVGSSPRLMQQPSFTSPGPSAAPGYAPYPSASSPPPGMSVFSAPPPVLPASRTLDPSTLTMRKGQLCDFYAFNDPSRDNIPDHVDALFDKYSFEAIKQAVVKKYGVAPAGW